MAFYLSVKEIWRSKGRFLLFSMVIALITVLVLFIAGLAEGLAAANREYLAKLDGELIVFQEDVKLSTLSSRINDKTIRQINRVDGISSIGPVGFGNTTIIIGENEEENIDVSLIGIEPNLPGGAPALEGRNLRNKRAYEAVIDSNVAERANLSVGDTFTIKSIQGTEDEYFELSVAGITDGRQFFFQPSIFVPTTIWDKIRPQAATGSANGEITYNVAVVRLDDPTTWESMAAIIKENVDGIEVVDPVTAYESSPGYQAQQSTLNTQRGFTLLIGILVIGGFFQIQTLQRVPIIGMLKAVGVSNRTVGLSVVAQILAVTVVGVLLGSLGTLALAQGLPAVVPIRFTSEALIAAILSLLIIGPVGGLVSVRLALKAEPLMAVGLSS